MCLHIPLAALPEERMTMASILTQLSKVPSKVDTASDLAKDAIG